MPYLNVDDGELDNEKVEGLTDAAYRLWSMARLYSARNLTDGRIPLSKLRRLTDSGDDVVITELERAGLLHLGPGCGTSTCPDDHGADVQVHDYLQWNHSRDWWLDRRKRERERKDEYRRNRRKKAVPEGVPAGQPEGQDA